VTPVVAELFAAAGSPVEPAGVEVLEAYLTLLLRWSRRMSLTGFADRRSAAEGLLLDAVELAPLIPRSARVVDVGAGAGGLATALRVIRPDLALAVVEPRSRRAAFLRAVRRELRLERVDVIEGRADRAALPWPADAAYARAVMPLAEWIPLGAGLVRPGGLVLCLSAEPVEPQVVPPGLTAVGERRYRVPSSGAGRVVTALATGSQDGSLNSE
jgi:16S rRNA (guanine527-N7)-methyltransferase